MILFNSGPILNKYDYAVKRYEEKPIEKGKILFYGAYTFTRWTEKYGNGDLEDAILNKDGTKGCINHGFGSATAETLLYFYDRLVRPWEPKVLVLKNGGNDPTSGYSPIDSFFLLSRIINYARVDMPGIQFYLSGVHGNYVTKADIALWRDEYNELLKDYSEKHDDCTYVNYTDSPLFFDNLEDVGNPNKLKPSFFLDGRHFNAEGYKASGQFWTEVLDKYL